MQFCQHMPAPVPDTLPLGGFYARDHDFRALQQQQQLQRQMHSRMEQASADVAQLAALLLTRLTSQKGASQQPPPPAPAPSAQWDLPLSLYDVHDVPSAQKSHNAEHSSTQDGDAAALSDFTGGSEEDVSQMIAIPHAPRTCPQGRTTLMIRNVPLMYTQELLIKEWPINGEYDLLYLPRTGDANLSYAFVNFVSEAHAEAFKAHWQKKRLAHFTSRKPLNIGYAEVQGLKDNLQELKKKRARRMQLRQCEPIVLLSGRQVPYPEAVAAVVGRSGAGANATPMPWAAAAAPPQGVGTHAWGALPYGLPPGLI